MSFLEQIKLLAGFIRMLKSFFVKSISFIIHEAFLATYVKNSWLMANQKPPSVLKKFSQKQL